MRNLTDPSRPVTDREGTAYPPGWQWCRRGRDDDKEVIEPQPDPALGGS